MYPVSQKVRIKIKKKWLNKDTTQIWLQPIFSLSGESPTLSSLRDTSFPFSQSVLGWVHCFAGPKSKHHFPYLQWMVRDGNRTKLANESVPQFLLEPIEKDVLPTSVANLSGYKLRAASGHLSPFCRVCPRETTQKKEWQDWILTNDTIRTWV